MSNKPFEIERDKPKWTPGPWVMDERDVRASPPRPAVLYGELLATVYPTNADEEGDGFFPEVRANTRLIAAVPLMAEALEAVVDHVTDDLGRWQISEALAKARAALRAAKGEA